MKRKGVPQKLYGCWHPVAYAHELSADKPMSAQLLDEPVVLWRTADGTPQAMKDVIESQRPDQVPFDLADELHLKFDAVAVNYRRAMQQQGLDYYHYLDVADE